MPPKDLVVFLDETEASRDRLAYAATLAARWQAHLVTTFVSRPLIVEPHAGFAVGEALTDLLEVHRREVTASGERARAGFDALIARQGISGEWRMSLDEPGEALMLHARHASLAVLGPVDEQVAFAAELGLSTRMVFASGRPCLLLPAGWPEARQARRIVVGWNGGREATRAIADAMPLLVDADAVHLVVVPDARVQALYGQEPGADMAAHLARQGVPVVLEQCQGEDAGEVLLGRCSALQADLLVMGAMGRSRISEFVLGGATRTVFARAMVPLLLSG